ncbi:glycosyltransferase family 2 protein, partial [Actinomycetota bacterium]
MKLVSIIIPTHDGAEFIQGSIDSVLKQDYKNIEIIVVDDNGKGTEKQLKTQRSMNKFANEKRIKYIVHKYNKNGSVARNTGAKISRGEYLNFIDDDDRLLPGKLRYQVEQLDKLEENWGASYSSKATTYKGKIINKTKAKHSGELLFAYMMHNISIGPGSLLIRKNVWKTLNGFDESFTRHQDWEFVSRMLDKYKIIAASSVYYERNFVFRHQPNSIKTIEGYMDHWMNKVKKSIVSLSPFEMRLVIVNNYMGIALKYLRNK